MSVKIEDAYWNRIIVNKNITNYSRILDVEYPLNDIFVNIALWQPITESDLIFTLASNEFFDYSNSLSETINDVDGYGLIGEYLLMRRLDEFSDEE